MKKEDIGGMSVVVKTVVRLCSGFVMLFGLYILSHGHISPGGGFSGGVIVALSFLQLILAFGKESAYARLPKIAASIFESLGALFLLALALLGFTGGYFFFNFISKGTPFRLFSAGIIPLANIAISLKVGTGIFAIFIAFLILQFESERGNHR